MWGMKAQAASNVGDEGTKLQQDEGTCTAAAEGARYAVFGKGGQED